jgi:hypothetical protein
MDDIGPLGWALTMVCEKTQRSWQVPHGRGQ